MHSATSRCDVTQLAGNYFVSKGAKCDKIWAESCCGANHSNNIDNSIGTLLAGDDAFLAVFLWIEKHIGWEEATGHCHG